MNKNTFYFTHDGNARNDEKIIAVRMKYGCEGYGIYFMLIEKLFESSDYMCVKNYNHIAFDLRVGADKVKSIIEDFNLFQFSDDDDYFYSESLLDRMIPLNNLKNQRSEAGKKSAEKRKINDRCEDIQRPLTKKATERKKERNKEEKEIKEKEIKENFDFDFLNENPKYLILIKKWIEYKKQISSPVETQMQLEAIYKDLLILSNNSTVEAEKIINYSIGGKCKNLYQREIKSTNNGSKTGNRFNPSQAKIDGGYGQL